MSTTPHIAAIILAAGQSRRMGATNKLTATVANAPLLTHVLRATTTSNANPVLVVTGHDQGTIGAIIDDFDVKTVANAQYAEGMASSIRAGIASLPTSCDGALICLGDMPNVTAKHLDALIAAFDPHQAPVCAPIFNGQRGNPVLWGRQFFDELLALTGDVGAREMLKRHAALVRNVAMADDGVLTDVDTPDALRTSNNRDR